ncbi:hypothetical protein K474DRAFT_1758284 [Panus rudis PR-1116 ss-1]|nr:hypothetical protein K474DRAFT_1758284 [Panus rudis PR-1116 ss-1]
MGGPTRSGPTPAPPHMGGIWKRVFGSGNRQKVRRVGWKLVVIADGAENDVVELLTPDQYARLRGEGPGPNRVVRRRFPSQYQCPLLKYAWPIREAKVRIGQSDADSRANTSVHYRKRVDCSENAQEARQVLVAPGQYSRLHDSGEGPNWVVQRGSGPTPVSIVEKTRQNAYIAVETRQETRRAWKLVRLRDGGESEDDPVQVPLTYAAALKAEYCITTTYLLPDQR